MTDVQPLLQPKKLVEDDLKTYVLHMLGAPFVTVEVKPEQITTFITSGLERYSRLMPKLRYFSIPAFAGIQEYELPRDTIGFGVCDVMIPRLDPIAPLLLSSGPRLDIFGYRYSYPYRDISELYIDYFYFKEATRILSADFDWEYLDGAIRIHPKPDEPFPLTYVSAFPRDLDSFPADDFDWLKDYVLGSVKVAVGHARRKFGTIPGAQTGQQLDGAQMISEGMQMVKDAEEDLLLRTPPFPLWRT